MAAGICRFICVLFMRSQRNSQFKKTTGELLVLHNRNIHALQQPKFEKVDLTVPAGRRLHHFIEECVKNKNLRKWRIFSKNNQITRPIFDDGSLCPHWASIVSWTLSGRRFCRDQVSLGFEFRRKDVDYVKMLSLHSLRNIRLRTWNKTRVAFVN